MNKLYYDNNLDAFGDLEDESIDLIYADPPFNSGHNYKAESGSFKDKWEWNDESKSAHRRIAQKAIECPVARKIDRCLVSYRSMFEDATQGKWGALLSYLAFLGERFIELHRVLKPTGSIYLHCDPTASHYIKSLMDQAFGIDNFRNEIVWAYQAGSNTIHFFRRKHDIIFYYVKSKKYTFNRQSKPVIDPKIYNQIDNCGRSYRSYHINGQNRRYYLDNGQTCDDVWTYVHEKCFQSINPMSNEKIGYPTQKPIALLKRIIQASSNEGDMVLDPFAGSGTILDAALSLNRNWIGIDQEPQAIETITKRLADEHGLLPDRDYEINGFGVLKLDLPTKASAIQTSLF